MAKQAKLLTQRRFLPYFLTQSLGAFNDNIYKNTLLLFVAFASVDSLPISSNLFINLAAGLFILPFFLFSAFAGVLADKYEKSAFIRKVKLAEIVIMLFGAMAFILQNYTLLLILLFLMGTQSAFFGPVKYALLPQQLKKEELVTGNALVETGTFLAILFGTIGAGFIASQDNAEYIAAGAVVLFAVLGYLSSRHIPHTKAIAPNLVFKWQPIQQTKQTLNIAKEDPSVFLAIMGISWFWFLGASYLTQFPNYSHLHLNDNAITVTVLLALFSIGIAIGSLACDMLSKHRVEIGIIPLGCLGISLFGMNFYLSTPSSSIDATGFIATLLSPELLPVFINLLFLGICGGLYIVPLYTLIQQRPKPEHRSQIIAANNIYNALFMVASAILGIVCLSVLELSIPQFFALLAIMNGVVALFLLCKVPVFVIRFLLWIITHTLYRVKHKNLHHLPEEGGALLVCNHITYMDAFILSGACPRPIRFVMEEEYAELPLVKYFFRLTKVIPINATKSSSIRRAFLEVEAALSEGEIVLIFPEGVLTHDGEVGSFLRGIDIILKRSPVPVVPMALRGLWQSFFSRHGGKAILKRPSRCWSKIEVVAGEPVPPHLATSSVMREKVIQLRGDWQ
ncbi:MULTISPECIES: MFS transporter [Aliivibrio]|uniref:MFS transporter n=1 Tax=Aliivibrio finisterrensis TaxID=511998 RepID=A0A4Q5KU60_9GAMM|nr:MULTISPECIES: MFS transporter [Aliivibrio]MDD9179051.1 MFS transporter [Aliivibrio sp. A6]RYU51515.1 MFS transporter [Aliivibrio finisterrensis]RYU52740.1 MFS transporter [Aliivibrio finisterrensis]RYU58238.1 MFS transporter [Aliivibrio finisterrensis]RYU64054.1 MFS transporter [Aliivibrio finisterrensis]